MIKHLLIALISIAFFTSCNKADSLANKTILEIGNGKYSKTSPDALFGEISYVISKNENIFSTIEKDNLESSLHSISTETLFQTNTLFSNIELIEKNKSNIDTLKRKVILSSTMNPSLRKHFLDRANSTPSIQKINDSTFIEVSQLNTSLITYRYKVNASGVLKNAKLKLMNIEGNGYRVTSFMFE